MPSLDGKMYSYDKKGYKAYIRALKKKRRQMAESGDQKRYESASRGQRNLGGQNIQ
tara:strand:- start:141 stop:308 length:168 start_codon:yes stop_codon:yes gene_type:complete